MKTTYYIIENGRTLVKSNNKFYSVEISENVWGNPVYSVERALISKSNKKEALESAEGWANVVNANKALEIELDTTL